ncbi:MULTISPECIES: phage baseplate protein [unclassified Moorena]|uniref:T4 family baseplate hub assembly chaperone n=1 Tax=unclassified Moorena TaxID=2683338 RepID=UPI0013CA5FB9|nr:MULTISPECIES: phage baseplate protein [unclassified Moorena]NEO19102.1 phage baseplate protein [Moorena sp. SIO4A5]NEP25155.1 phage baseplate protein [Moorena sp. SIO3I6]NEQ56718.1 phage baseplate protein [Moorena sp. SIO4A1]
MRSLSADKIIKCWEIGQVQHPLDRALTLLRFAFPDKSAVELASLSIGQRDGYLLSLREITFGPKLNSFAECPNCRERLEFTMNVGDMRLVDPFESKQQEYQTTVNGYRLQFRLPNSWDLATIVNYTDETTASKFLGKRCLLEASYDGMRVAYEDLPRSVVTQLAEQIAECDPQGEMLLNLNCPACGHGWQVLFDIVSFFWIELSAQAKRLLRQVHRLARFYGWREADILSMSTVRRQFYLELID